MNCLKEMYQYPVGFVSGRRFFRFFSAVTAVTEVKEEVINI